MASEREFVDSERMTEYEALMWNIEKDPWLNASGAALTVLDQPLDMDRFRRQMRYAVSKMPKLYQRVVPGLARLSTPAWAPDPEFDLDYHVRQVELPDPGDERALLDLATALYLEPFDRTRPLWRFVAISGLEGGRGALWSITHHVIADGIGQLRMAELYQSLDRNEPPAPEVDLEGIIASAVEQADIKESGGAGGEDLITIARDTATHLVRRQVGLARRAAGELVMWPADPKRILDHAGSITSLARSTAKQVLPRGEGDESGSTLWRNRSRHRRLDHVRVRVDDLKTAGKEAGATLNDVFLAGLAEAAWRYHDERGEPVQSFNSSFVLSTRDDSKAGGNSFTPVPIQLQGRALSLRERVVGIHELTSEARGDATRTGGLATLSGLMNQLPTSVVARAARSTAGRIDFATSNLRGAPFELYCAGSKVEAMICLGPVAGTGANITAMSYAGWFDIGIFSDPTAIEDGQAFRDHVEASFADLFVELGV